MKNRLPMFTDLEEIIKLDYDFYEQLINDGITPTKAFLTATINFLYKENEFKPEELHNLIERISTSTYLKHIEKKRSLNQYSDIELRAELFMRYLDSEFDEFDLFNDEEIETNPINDYVVEVSAIDCESELGVSHLDMSWCEQAEDDEIDLVEDEDGNLTRPIK
ncbi:hypothetical protein CO725_01035 [Vibrio parahaemolyticus]|uniref:hypothetical protein n=1 Tax=Vibrio parahaemolyticus TaxID=670 RepID=UPI000BE2C2EE|nr:hypothetical protein [Vibrio parahaemolyticus]ATI44271.1 hypothetical protein CO725_01035 [Vibrio parahaemolyticus]